MAIRRTTISVTGATGGAGVATATANSDKLVTGYIVAVHLAYLDTPPATTDVTITTTESPTPTILTVSNAATDGWFYPRASAVTTANGAITDSAEKIAVSGYLTGTIAQANNADGVTITVVYEEL